MNDENATPGVAPAAAPAPEPVDESAGNQLTLDEDTAAQLSSCAPGDEKRVELIITVNSSKPFSATVKEVTEIEDAGGDDDEESAAKTEQAPAVAKLKSKPTGETMSSGMGY